MDIHPNANLRKQNGQMLFITSCFVSSTVILKFGRRPLCNDPNPFNQGASHASNLRGQSGCFGGGMMLIWEGNKLVQKRETHKWIGSSTFRAYTSCNCLILIQAPRKQCSRAVKGNMKNARGLGRERDTAPLHISRASYGNRSGKCLLFYELPTAFCIYPLSVTITSVFNLWKSFSQSFSDKKLHTSLQKRQPVRNFKI